MEPLTFREIARLINRIGITRIDDSPSAEEKGQWALYAGTVHTGAIAFQLKIMHVLADATKDGTREARSILQTSAKRGEQVQVVLAPSLKRENASLVEAFRELYPSTLFLDEFFASFIRQQVDNYLSKVGNLPCSNYVDPQIRVSDGFKRTSPNPVVNFLTDPDTSSSMFQGTLGVLLAEPGQGKTFMTRYLASEVAKRGRIPLYVHSEQWSRMQTDDIASIWKTVVHSFKHFDSPIGWIDGAEEEFIKVCLRAGLFCVIFDGFDEYVLWNRGAVDALETINTLQQMAIETGARILISARTSFWTSEIEENPEVGQLRPQHQFKIEPFDQTKASTYFAHRFSQDPIKQDNASKLFSHLKQRVSDTDMDFVGRGFFLFLIADLVNRGFTLGSLQLTNRTVLQWIMEELCERERTRQKIPFSTDEQIRVLEEFCELVVNGEEPSTETLKFAFKSCTDHQESEVDAVFSGRVLKDHPLIRLDQGRDEWNFIQDQIRYALIGQRLLALCDPVRGRINDAKSMLRQPAFNPQLQTDVAIAIANQLFEVQGTARALDRVKDLIATILGQYHVGQMDAGGNAAAFATTLALISVNKALPAGSQHAERTRSLVSLFPGSKLSGLSFSGTLARFDFCGMTFDHSAFNQVIWANCRFDAQTRFVSCRAHGGSVLSCKQFGLAEWDGACSFDEIAKNLIEAEAVREGRRAYSVEDLRGDINYVLRKFIPKESLGLRTVSVDHLPSGVIGASIHCREVIDAVKRHVLAEHTISSVNSRGLHVLESAKESMLYWATNGVYTGPLSELFDDLKNKIGL